MYAIRVSDENGDDYVCDGLGDKPSLFTSRAEAEEFADFVSEGLDDDAVVQVVRYTRSRRI